jgi:hypothetical protein
VRTTGDEIEQLSGDALKLLSKLRKEHSARCERGETFAIAVDAMSRAKFMGRRRLEKARAMLLRKKLIVKVSAFRNTAAGRVAAQYRLVMSNTYQGGGAGAGAV